MQKQKIIVLLGPTASGKSALAVELARRVGGEIISADSRQVYRGLDIGTGKITKREMKGVPHHMLDVASPKKVFTAHDFVVHAQKIIQEIRWRGKLPIICGGTGFYIDALVGRIKLSHVPVNKKLRARLDKKFPAELFAQLMRLDPKRAKSIDRNNKRRLIRAIEIGTSTKLHPPRLNFAEYEVLWIGLAPERDDLRERINARLTERLRRGMVAEAKRLKAAGLSYKRMHDLGLEYRSLARYLRGKISKQELATELQNAIWHYAKRQMTYWHRNKEIHWSKPNETKTIAKTVSEWLKDV